MVVNYLDVVGIKKDSDIENIRFSITQLHKNKVESLFSNSCSIFIKNAS